MRNIDFGMPTLIEISSLHENVELCKRLGLKFIELNMNFPEYQLDSLEERIEEIYQEADNAGIYYTIHLDENLNIADFNPLVRNAYSETVRRTIEVAKKLYPLYEKYGRYTEQALTINMHMNHGIYITLPNRKVQLYAEKKDVYMDFFRHFIKDVETWIGDFNIKIVIENTDGFKDYEITAIDELLKSNYFGLTWDIGHSKAVKEKDVAFIESHMDKLIHMHVHDGTEEPPKNHLALGTGAINLTQRLDTAECVRAKCVLETKTIVALEKSVRWLDKELIKA